MYGTALIDLYSTNFSESNSRKSNSSNDGNGNSTSIIKNRTTTSIVKDQKKTSSGGLRNLLFDSSNKSKQQKNEPTSPYAYHTLSDYPHNELLVNISEEEEKPVQITSDEKLLNDQSTPVPAPTTADKLSNNNKRHKNSSEFKSSSDGAKMKQFINKIPISSSMQTINDKEIRSRQNSTQHQIDFGKVIARFPMIYVGQKFLDKKMTLPMLRWIVAEFRREVLQMESHSPSAGSNQSFNSSPNSNSFSLIYSPSKKERKKIWFEITDRCILGFDRQQSGFDQLSKSLTGDSEKEAFSRMNVLNEGFIFLHKNQWICKIQSQPHEDGCNELFSFAYLTRDFGDGFGQNNENKPYTLHVFECDEKQIVSLLFLFR